MVQHLAATFSKGSSPAKGSPDELPPEKHSCNDCAAGNHTGKGGWFNGYTALLFFFDEVLIFFIKPTIYVYNKTRPVWPRQRRKN